VDPQTRFREVFNLAYAPLSRYARHRGLDGPDAEDLVAQALEVAWRKIDEVPADDPLPWLYAVARNLWRNHERRDRRRRDLLARFRLARPAPDYQPAAASPAAAAMLARILAGNPPPAGRARAPRAVSRRLVLASIPVVAGAAAAGTVVASTFVAAGPSAPAAASVWAAVLAALDRSTGDILITDTTDFIDLSDRVPNVPPVQFRALYYPMGYHPERAGRWRFITSRNGVPVRDEAVAYTPPANGVSYGPINGADVVVIDYATRTWSRGHQAVGSPVLTPDIIRQWVANGFLKVAGPQRLHGVDAIKLTSRPEFVPSALWVDARTYLPLQAVTTLRDAHGKVIDSETTRYQVLPATAANLALLKQPPAPVGFTRTPLSLRPYVKR
jgi:hypothetical protein